MRGNVKKINKRKRGCTGDTFPFTAWTLQENYKSAEGNDFFLKLNIRASCELQTERSNLATSSHCRYFSLQSRSLQNRSMGQLASFTQTATVVKEIACG